MSFARYGTAHEALEDEKNTAVSRRPTAVHEEVVTDEKGRRRFHGAFTGGFSAGYFNTVGSRHGWVPQTFKSTRGERAENVKQSANDFMDEEDKGEFGFAARKIRPKQNFVDQLGGTGQKHEQLAWERAGPSSGGQSHINDIDMQLAKTFQGISDSIGVKILKSMGWRPGKGIGPRMTRRQLEKQKVRDARQLGRHHKFNEEEVAESEEIAPQIEFAPDDIETRFLQPNAGNHGLGYKPLEHSNVLEEDFHFRVDAYKEKQKSKGIRGQAFGVGAFEEDDDDIYTSEDLSKYDYVLGGEESTIKEVARYETNFIPAAAPERQVFYKAPEPPKHFNRFHRPQPILLREDLPDLGKAFSQLNPLQRAVFLGDRSGSVMELLNTEDRKKLQLLTKKAEVETKFEKPEKRERRAEPEPFEEEPMKAHRFKKYVHYLKSGHVMAPPTEMTLLEWEEECKQFEHHLTPELRSLLPSVRDRQQPLARLSTAQPIADMLKSRFQSENAVKTEPTTDAERAEQDKRDAVKRKQFGALTRQKYNWHPSKYLSKYFNVEDPYPDSREEGCHELQKKKPNNKDYDLDNLGLPSTQKDVVDRIAREAGSGKRTRWEEPDDSRKNQPVDKTFEAVLPTEERPTFLPPVELLQTVFESTLGALEDSSSSSESSRENSPEIDIIKVLEAKQREQIASKPPPKFINVVDLIDDDEYGPQIPTELPEAIAPEQKQNFVPTAPGVIQLSSDDESSDEDSEDDSHRKKKRRKRERSEGERSHKHHKKHKHKKEKKPKKSKKHKRARD